MKIIYFFSINFQLTQCKSNSKYPKCFVSCTSTRGNVISERQRRKAVFLKRRRASRHIGRIFILYIRTLMNVYTHFQTYRMLFSVDRLIFRRLGNLIHTLLLLTVSVSKQCLLQVIERSVSRYRLDALAVLTLSDPLIRSHLSNTAQSTPNNILASRHVLNTVHVLLSRLSIWRTSASHFWTEY